MIVSELIEELKKFNLDKVVLCTDKNGKWANIQEVIKNKCTIQIIFGNKSLFPYEYLGKEDDHGKDKIDEGGNCR